MSAWKKIYETDQTGATVFGNLNDFRAAVIHGADVKVLYSTTFGNWWSRYCSSVNVSGFGSNTRIAATFMEAADTQSVAGGLGFITNPFAIEYHLFNTSGARAFVKVRHSDQSILTQSTNIIRMRWYVKDYELSPLIAVTIDPDILTWAVARMQKDMADEMSESSPDQAK